jgi:BirA family biotin operon repressor/biotin-[acetyl-CoA-carboxylase] ligase
MSGRTVEPDELLDALLADLAPRYGRLNQSAGKDAIRQAMRKACTTLGRRCRVTLEEGELEGIATDLADDGRLLVDVGGSTRAIDAADVVYLRDAPTP